MGAWSQIRKWFSKIFQAKMKEEFEVKDIVDKAVEEFVKECAEIYKGNPEWIKNADDDIVTINMAETVAVEAARLATLAIGIQVEGSKRADFINEQIQKIMPKLREWVEYAIAYGTVILKPNGTGVSLVLPEDFMITKSEDNDITGVVFVNKTEDKSKYYTRFEYHRFENENERKLYRVTNICYEGRSENDVTEKVSIEKTPWAGLMEDTWMENVEKPLYGVLKCPGGNKLDPKSAMALPIFAKAIQELEDLDIAYSRNRDEIHDSSRTVLVDEDRLPLFSKASKMYSEEQKRQKKLPRFVRALEGTGGVADDIYHEINPQLNTETRIKGINYYVSNVGYKCGFSSGYFVFDEKTGMVTATQVESDDRRTIQLIKDIRDKVQEGIEELLYALDKFADLYGLTPRGKYEAHFDFGDITYNYQEDKDAWWKYVQAGKVPAWKYFVKFEGMTEEEAKQMQAEMEQSQELFAAE